MMLETIYYRKYKNRRYFSFFKSDIYPKVHISCSFVNFDRMATINENKKYVSQLLGADIDLINFIRVA